MQNIVIFDEEESQILNQNLIAMRNDIRLRYGEVLDISHHGFPVIMEIIQTGHRGRPQFVFNPEFLRFAYAHRSISGIARFLGVSRDTVRKALLEHGIIQPRNNPFSAYSAPLEDHENEATGNFDDLLDPQFGTSLSLPANPQEISHNPHPLPPQSSVGELPAGRT